MRRLREQADADQEHAATMQQQCQFDREHSAELTATILQLAKLVEEIVRLMMSLIATMLGQQYNIQHQPQVEAKQQNQMILVLSFKQSLLIFTSLLSLALLLSLIAFSIISAYSIIMQSINTVHSSKLKIHN